MSRVEAERAFTIVEAAELKSVSPGFIRAAIKATEGATLAAKKVGKGYRISATALEEWWAALPDG